MVDYTVSIKRPFSDLTKLLIGIVLSIIPIVNIIAFGYTLTCAKTAMKKKFDLPEWENIVGLFVSGLLAAIIGLIYAIIPVAIIAVSAGAIIYSIWAAVMAGTMPAVGSLLVGSGIGLVIGLLVLLLAAYLAPMAILNYVNTNEFGSAFSGEVFRKAFTAEYLVAWIVAMVYQLVLLIILVWIPFIGPAIASFIGGVSAWTIFGLAYSEIK